MKLAITQRAMNVVDFVSIPATFLSALILKIIRRAGIQRLPLSRSLLLKMGVFPVRNHYYDPFFNPKAFKTSLRSDRNLPGIDLNVQEQLELLNSLSYQNELKDVPMESSHGSKKEYYYHNGSFGSVDADVLYSFIRHFKPKRIIEIGSGFSTLMAVKAVDRNKAIDPAYSCDHICIEPFEMPWLEAINVRVIRKTLEECDLQIFQSLEKNDILFIDSSHIIKPQGDVLIEYLQVLPSLKSGVIVHIHDIFTPKDYLDEWVIDQVKFWNEQYLLEAFLSHSKSFRIICALNFLKHTYPKELTEACPILKSEPNREPGSFWIVRN